MVSKLPVGKLCYHMFAVMGTEACQCYCEIICLWRWLRNSTSLRWIAHCITAIENWWLAHSQYSSIQCLRPLHGNDNKTDWDEDANLATYNTKWNTQTNQMSVICFAPSGTPPWNNLQSQRLPNVSHHRKGNYNSTKDITKPRWPGKTHFLAYRDSWPTLCILPTG